MGHAQQNQESIVSVTGAPWCLREVDARQVLLLTQRFNLPEIVARTLVARGIDADGVEDYLHPTLKRLMPNPQYLLDMDKAVQRLVQAIENDESVVVFGDYDVDGATSSSLLVRFFALLDKSLETYIPDRIEEGYGPSVNAMRSLAESGHNVCITVDCGTLAFEPLEEAKKQGMDVVVIDHHLSEVDMPEAVAVVNPNRLDENSDEGHLAAVGVVFLLIVALKTALKERGFFEGKDEPDLMQLLDLVALGTICDVVPLKGVNRAFVMQGLQIMKKRQNIGLKALTDVSSVHEEIAPYHLGFVLGPRVNAGGRVGKSSLGTTLLSTTDTDEAYGIAMQLDGYNKERKAIEQEVLEASIAQVEASHYHNQAVIFVRGEGWHPGVIGIVASRLKERYHRPVAVMSIDGDIAKASARSVSGVDFGSAVVSAKQRDLLVAGGGHAMAAGFTVELSKIDQLFSFLNERFAPHYDMHMAKQKTFDAFVSPSGVTSELYHQIKQLEPFGAGNAEPRFVVSSVYVDFAKIVGERHVSCTLKSSDGGRSLRCISFQSVDNEIGGTLLSSKGQLLHVLGKIRLNDFNGMNRAELTIEDVALA